MRLHRGPEIELARDVPVQPPFCFRNIFLEAFSDKVAVKVFGVEAGFVNGAFYILEVLFSKTEPLFGCCFVV